MNELEALGEALMTLSAQLHRLDTLADAQAHAAYERVVDRFNRAWNAQAIEARRAETGTGSVVDESAVAKPCAPTPPSSKPTPLNNEVKE